PATPRIPTRRNSKRFRWRGTKSGRIQMNEDRGRGLGARAWFRAQPTTPNPQPPTPMKVYLDNSATTAMAAEVIEAMLPYFSEEMGNAQSVHSFGQRAKSAIEKARRLVAALINASPTEIVFVSGGTEADNLAIRGIADAHRDHGHHIITTRVEHPAVLRTCEALEA